MPSSCSTYVTVWLAAAVSSAGPEAERHRAKKALAAGDSLAAMEAFAAAARRHEEDRGDQEARVEHLNETSFDRRRKVAVYKTDGRRGHHMQVRLAACICAVVTEVRYELVYGLTQQSGSDRLRPATAAIPVGCCTAFQASTIR